MSNVKWVEIKGTIPYNCDEHAGFQPYLAKFNRPSFGLRISFANERYVPNDQIPTSFKNYVGNGQTAIYDFSIYGEEAVNKTFIEGMIEAIVEAGGTITTVYCKDIEAGEIYTIKVPAPSNKQRYVVSFSIDNPSVGGFQDTWLMEIRRILDIPLDNCIFSLREIGGSVIKQTRAPEYVRRSVWVRPY